MPAYNTRTSNRHEQTGPLLRAVRILKSNQLIIEISDQQSFDVDPTLLTATVRKILTDHDYHCGEISIALVDDPQIHQLNRQYLDHDYETDVISFALDSEPESGLLNGQLVISTQTAQRVADQMALPFTRELLLYTIHGALHLVGYDDVHDADIREMRTAEAKYLEWAAGDTPVDGNATGPVDGENR